MALDDSWLMKWPVAIVVVLVGCGAGARTSVRQSDVNAWRAIPVSELETHALFSTAPLTKRKLSNGSELWDYTTCRSYQEDLHCLSTPGAFGSVNSNCGGGGTSTSCCHNQFFVRAGLVESYRPTGYCYTDCVKRPGGRCDDVAEARMRAAGASAERLSDDSDPAVVAVRRSPRVPEVGATVAEIRSLCQQQRAEFVNRSAVLGCRIRNDQIFACTLDTDSRADRCDGYYESADIAASRQLVESKLGPPVHETVSGDGFRVFEWTTSNETITLTMYAKGVLMTHARLPSGNGFSTP